MTKNSKTPLIEARGLGIFRDGETLLQDVDLAVHAREIVAVVGPNGGGKTLLLQTLLGLSPPNTGTINRLPGLRIGYVPQRVVIDETLPLTVGRFIRLGPAATRDRIKAVAHEVQVETVLDRPIQRISGGELQRTLLARALLGDPRLLVLDEPGHSLDIARLPDLYALLRDLREKRGCAILLVSHDLQFTAALADRIIGLNRSVLCTGTSAEVRVDPAFRALFPGFPTEAVTPALGDPNDG